MALGFNNLDPGAEETTTDGTMTSASISPASGAIVYVTIIGTNASLNLPQDGSVSGLGGTWTAMATSIQYGSRRVMQIFRGTKATAWGSGTLTIGAPGDDTTQDMAYIIDEVTGADSADPDDTPVSGVANDAVTLADVGTVDAGDGVFVVGAHESAGNSFACTGYTGLTTLDNLTNVRQIKTWYDTSSPDETPNITSAGGGNATIGWAWIVNVGAGGTNTDILVPTGPLR